jgi:hypothetical protein
MVLLLMSHLKPQSNAASSTRSSSLSLCDFPRHSTIASRRFAARASWLRPPHMVSSLGTALGAVVDGLELCSSTLPLIAGARLTFVGDTQAEQ